MKYGYSIWYGSKDIISEIARAKSLGFDYVEVSLDFIWPEGLKRKKEAIKNAIRQNGLEISFIAPHSGVQLGNPRREIREGAQKLLKKVISFVSYFDPIFLIFYIRGDSEPLHFSEFISHKKIKNVEDAIEKASHESLKILTREARKRNVQLAMENSGKGKFSTADDFIPYLKYEEFNLCYDIGHSIRSSSSRDVYKIIEKWCKKFEKYIITSHIHDVKINREVIDHLNIGEGDLNFKEISNLLSITTCNYIKLETFSAYSSNSLLRKNLKEIKNAFKIFP